MSKRPSRTEVREPYASRREVMGMQVPPPPQIIALGVGILSLGLIGWAMIGSIPATPLVFGPVWGPMPAAWVAGIIVARTAVEDRTLQAKLPG